MKNKWFKIAAGVVAMAATATVQATPITGGISMNGSDVMNTGDVTTATQVTSWSDVQVSTDSGAFGGIAQNANVNMSGPWIFNPSTALGSLWSVGGFTFNVASDVFTTYYLGGVGYLSVTGFGTITAAGYDPTAYSWQFSTSNPPTPGTDTFTFSATAASVPDGGATVMLLGAALSAMGLLRRKLIA